MENEASVTVEIHTKHQKAARRETGKIVPTDLDTTNGPNSRIADIAEDIINE